jgi:hypothetical protein
MMWGDTHVLKMHTLELTNMRCSVNLVSEVKAQHEEEKMSCGASKGSHRSGDDDRRCEISDLVEALEKEDRLMEGVCLTCAESLPEIT